MFVTISKVNGKAFDGEKKEVRPQIYIPICFIDEAQYDRWFEETLLSGKYKFYHLRKNNKPEIQYFENLELELKFS